MSPYIALVIVTGCYFIGVGMCVPAVPRLVATGLGGDVLQAGIAVAAFSLGALVFRPLPAFALRRLSGGQALALGTTISALATAALLVAQRPSDVIVLRFIGGLGEAFFFTLASAAVYEIVPSPAATQAQTLFSASVYGAIYVGAALGEQVRAGWGFSATWVLAAAVPIAGVAALPVLGRLNFVPPKPSKMLLATGALGPGVLLTVSTVAMAAFATFAPIVSAQRGTGNLGPEYLLLALVVVMLRLGTPRIPATAPFAVAGAALGATACGLALLALNWSWVTLVLAALMLGVGQAYSYPALIGAVVAQASNEDRPAEISTFTAFYDVGALVAPLALSTAAAALGFQSMYGATAALCALGATAALLCGRQTRAPA